MSLPSQIHLSSPLRVVCQYYYYYHTSITLAFTSQSYGELSNLFLQYISVLLKTKIFDSCQSCYSEKLTSPFHLIQISLFLLCIVQSV